MIYLKNNTETQSIYIPRQTVLGGGYITTTKTYEDGYNDGLEDGKKQQKDKLLNLYVTENGQYEREDGWDVVTVDIPIEGCPDCPEGGSCNLGEGALTLTTKDIGIYELNASDGGYDGWSKFVVELETAKPIPPQDGWGMVGYFNSWGGTPDIPFEENGEWEGRPYKVIRGFEAVQGEFKIRRNSAWADSYTADFYNEPQFAKLVRGDWNMPIDDGLWDIYLFFRDNGKPNEMLLLHSGTDLSTIKYEYTLIVSADKVNAIIEIGDGFDSSVKRYYGGSATVTMKYGCIYNINIYMEGYEDIYDETTCYNDETRSYTLTKTEGGEGGGSSSCNLEDKWVTPSMGDRDGNNLIVVEESEGYDGLSRVVIDPQTLYNEGVEAGRAEGGEGGSCNLINPIVFSENAGNTINVENVQIPTFVYEGNQYYNANSFNLADIEEFKIHILFKPNNSGDAEPINIFGCEDSDWDGTTFGARIYQGQITFRMSEQDVDYPYTENTWYDVEMGYNTTKKWVIVNGETLLDAEYASFNRPRQTLMIGAINSGGNAFRPFYGKIAAIYIESNGNQVWLLPKENGTMNIYWNNMANSRNSISGNNNARFENDYISGDGMKSITWLGNLEDKWVTPSMSERDDNGYIVVSPSEGYNGLSRTVINPQTIYNEGIEAGKTEKETDIAKNARVLEVTENGVYKSKFSDPIIPANYTVTGVYADGTNFYSYAELNGKVFNTNIPANKDSRIEFWWKNDANYNRYATIIGGQTDEGGYIFKFAEYSINMYRIEYGNHRYGKLFEHNFTYDMTSRWNHIIFSKQDGLYVNDELICNVQGEAWAENETIPNFLINAAYLREIDNNANGYFGMIKINDTIIIPTADGFQNVNTGELLEVVHNGDYTFTENLPIYAEGELYKTINVNVPTVQEQITDYYYCPITITDSGFGENAKSFLVKNENMYGENGWINDDSFVYLPTANNMNEVRTKTLPSSVASFPFDDNAAQYTGALYMNVEQIQMNNVVLPNLYKLELGSGCHTLRMESSNLPNINTLVIRYNEQQLFDYHFSGTQFKNGGKLYVYEGLGNAENLRAALGSEWTIEYL